MWAPTHRKLKLQQIQLGKHQVKIHHEIMQLSVFILHVIQSINLFSRSNPCHSCHNLIISAKQKKFINKKFF